MNTANLSWLLILEAVLPFLILNVVFVLIILSGKKKYKQAAKKLILSVKSTEDSEREAIIRLQTDKLSVKPKKAKRNAKNIINERKFVIRNLVSGLIDKNVEAISNINHDITQLTKRYHELIMTTTGGTGVDADEDKQQSVETVQQEDASIELRKEIKVLKQEVHITLTTLNNIFKEFSSMFGDDDISDEQMSVDQIITAMASFVEGSQQSKVTETEASDSTDTQASSETAVNVQTEPEEKSEGDVEEKIEEEAKPSPAPQAKSEKGEIQSPDNGDEAKVESADNAEADVDAGTQADLSSDTEAKKDADEESLDFSVDAAIDDIDSALDELELDSVEEEPDWGDAFEESGDKMEGDPK